jgi:pSer/pThr/pTyr-binding forkhead associated (FHA) protein
VVAGLGTGVIENVAKTGWMKVVGGLLTGKQFILYKNPTAIGSSPQCEIYLFKDPAVGPQHAAIQQLPVGYELQDLGTSTGTFLNGNRVTRSRLRNNDRIQIGSTVFLFQEKTKG